MCTNTSAVLTITTIMENKASPPLNINPNNPNGSSLALNSKPVSPCILKTPMDVTDSGNDVTDLLTNTETSIMGALLLVVFLASLTANAFVFVVFCKRKSLTMSNRFVANLTICNCLNTVLIMPFAFVSLLAKRWIFGSIWCLATGFLMNVFVSASIFTLAVISIDRYFAVVTPLHYTMRLTSRRCFAMIGIIWVAAFTVASPPLLGWNYIRFQPDKMICTVVWSNSSGPGRSYTFFLISSSFLLPLIAMLWTYARIFRAARRNSVRTRKNSVPRVQPVPPPTTNGTNTSDDSSQTTPINGRRRSSSVPIIRRFSQSSGRSSSLLWRLEEWKTAVTSFLVLFSFALCWTPYFVVMAMETGTGSVRPLNLPISLSSMVLALFSCACNPMVYVFRSKLVRKELKRIFRGGRPGSGHEVCVPHEYLNRRSSVIRNDSGRSLKSLDEVSDESGTLPSSTTATTLIPCEP